MRMHQTVSKKTVPGRLTSMKRQEKRANRIKDSSKKKKRLKQRKGGREKEGVHLGGDQRGSRFAGEDFARKA